jgi:hypothetical protein
MLSGPCLNVSSKDADRELGAALGRLREVHLVSGRAELEALLGELAARGAGRYATLDLIGHSEGPERLLRLGTWLIADDDETDGFIAAARPAVRALGVGQLRLLGCHTQCRPGGQAAIRRLARGLGFNVFGSYGVLNHHGYDADGINAYGADSLVCQDAFVECGEADPVGRRLGAPDATAGPRPESMTARHTPQVMLDRRQFASVGAHVEGEEPARLHACRRHRPGGASDQRRRTHRKPR